MPLLAIELHEIVAETLAMVSVICYAFNMTIFTKYLLLILLSLTGFVDGFLLFGATSPHIMWWFNPFMGMLYLVVLPFWGAMVMAFHDKESK